MPDGTDHGRSGGRHRPQQRLIAKGQQVLEAAASARDDDHVDIAHLVQSAQRLADLGDGGRALNGDSADLDVRSRPAAARVFNDIALGGAGPSADQADPPGEEGQGFLAIAIEEALRRQCAFEHLQASQEFAHADRADLAGIQHQGAALRPEGGLGLEHHALPLDNRGGHRVQGGDRDGHTHRQIGIRIPQRQVCRACARSAGELNHLPLDPEHAHLVDVLADLQAEQTQRPWVLSGGVAGPLGQGAAHRVVSVGSAACGGLSRRVATTASRFKGP